MNPGDAVRLVMTRFLSGDPAGMKAAEAELLGMAHIPGSCVRVCACTHRSVRVRVCLSPLFGLVPTQRAWFWAGLLVCACLYGPPGL